MHVCVCACVRVCVRVRARARARVCVCVCVCVQRMVGASQYTDSYILGNTHSQCSARRRKTTENVEPNWKQDLEDLTGKKVDISSTALSCHVKKAGLGAELTTDNAWRGWSVS